MVAKYVGTILDDIDPDRRSVDGAIEANAHAVELGGTHYGFDRRDITGIGRLVRPTINSFRLSNSIQPSGILLPLVGMSWNGA